MTRFFLPIAAGLLLAACQAQTPEPAAVQLPPDSATPDPVPASDEGVTARYACEGGNTVDLIHDGSVARLSLSDGRTIRLGEMSGSQPRTWSDVGLRFTIDDDFVELAQTNGERNLPCNLL